MTYEDWVLTLSNEDQEVFNRLIFHNMSLTKGHSGNMFTTKEWLLRPDWHESRYHYSSVEYENHLIDAGIKRADYPLVNNSKEHRWITCPYKR